jgi:Xaa-Pro dipeptidase
VSAAPAGPRVGQELPFEPAEHERRIALAQANLRERGLQGALLFDPENTFWLTGYQSIGYFTFQCLFLPLTGAPTLISRKVNAGLAAVNPLLDGFVEIPDTADAVTVLSQWLTTALPALPARSAVGLETASWFLSVRDFRALERAGSCAFEDWNGVVEAFRLDKTAEEVERIGHAARAAEQGLQAALDVAAPGKTENDLAAAMFHGAIAAGGEYLGHPPLVVSGERTALCFAMWRRRELRDGDVILLESGGCVDRYHAIVARSAVLGRATALQHDVAGAIIGGLEAAIAAIGPGVTSREADAACRGVIEQAGFAELFTHRTAYGVGIGFPPNWSEGKSLALRPEDDTVLRPGMTFHIVPTVFHRDFGMCFSETVCVTEQGCEVLTRFPRQLFEL